jgi:hypothetical protein
MFRSIIFVTVAALSLGLAAPVTAQENGGGFVAPSAAVADAWARETPTPKSLKVLYASYGVLQGLDTYSTIAARQNGAREANPLMNVGYAEGALVKGLMAAGTFAAVKHLDKKNRKAAVVTMVALNVVNATVVAINMRNAAAHR